MSNVTVQEALKAALVAIDLYDYTMTVEESEKFAKAERLCKAALVEIDKCEPVAHLKFISRQWIVSPEIGMDGFQGFEVCDKDEKGDDGSDAIAVYTSPQPRDWVGLSDERIEEIAKRNGAWQLYSSLKIFDFVANINDELKQLNTKG